MNENVLLHILITKLRKILPLKEFKFIEDESKKLFIFESIYRVSVYDDFYMGNACLKNYNKYRPLTKINDSILINLICARYTEQQFHDYLPVLRNIENGIVYLTDDWRLDITLKESKRQKEQPGFDGWYTIPIHDVSIR